MTNENPTPRRLLRLPKVMDAVGLSKTHIYDLMRKGLFPRGVKLSARAVAWPEEDVIAWIGARVDASAGQPLPTGGGQ